jgi:hypothetical protein
MTWFQIVEGDNSDSDYPEEERVNLPLLPKKEAEEVCSILNGFANKGSMARRYWRPESKDYKLNKNTPDQRKNK